MKANRLATVRRVTCPACGAELELTRAQVEHRTALCFSCEARLDLDAQAFGETPLRAMEQLEPRTRLPGPPTGRIEERAHEIIRQERTAARGLDGTVMAVLGLLAAIPVAFTGNLRAAAFSLSAIAGLAAVGVRVFGSTRVRVASGTVEVRSPLGWPRRIRVAEIDAVVVGYETTVLRAPRGADVTIRIDPRLGHGLEARRWIAQWLRERLR